MPAYEVLLIAVSMAMDAFAVCLVAGSLHRATGSRSAFRLSFHFGLFQFIMPVVGWLAGRTVEPLIQDYDHWIAFGLLAFVGVRMIIAAVRGEREPQPPDPSRGFTLIMLSVAVSIDALAVGLSIGLLGLSVWYPAIIIGLVTWLLSLVGLWLGERFGGRLGRPVEIAGGLVLLGIGIRIVASHLVG